jgi:hypothetical protein
MPLRGLLTHLVSLDPPSMAQGQEPCAEAGPGCKAAEGHLYSSLPGRGGGGARAGD